MSPSTTGSLSKAVTVGNTITLAGNGAASHVNGNINNSVKGVAIRFNACIGMTFDKDGNMYIAEDGAKCVRKISPAGDVSLLAGSDAGLTGTVDGNGSDARFTSVLGVAVHPITGDIYVTDQNRIRKITPAGVVSTFAGTTTAGYVDGTPANARFRALNDIIIDKDGNIYVTDRDNNAVRKYTVSTGLFTTLAGLGGAAATTNRGYADGNGTAARFDTPVGIALDDDGNIFVAERGSSNRIRKVTSSGVVSTIAGNGTAASVDGVGTNAGFNSPWDLVVAKNGNIYVADYSGNRIRQITTDGNVTTIAGSAITDATNTVITDGIGADAKVKQSAGIDIGPNGNLYFVERRGVLRTTIISAYTISPELPAGLTFNNLTGEITGTPTTVTAQSNYTINAYNGDGILEATTTLALSVVDGTLPVTLVNFNVRKATNGTVNITWQTSSETNSCYFTLERSNDGVNFQEIHKTASVSATGATYSYADKQPNVGTNYYRLTQVDCNGGKAEKLEEKSVTVGVSANSDWKVYPNPISGNSFSVQLPSSSAGQSKTVKIYSINGALVYSTVATVNEDSHINVKLSNKLSAGTYILDVNGLGTKKIIIK
ncbi:Virginiamycin B lyase [compost metagenome]